MLLQLGKVGIGLWRRLLQPLEPDIGVIEPFFEEFGKIFIFVGCGIVTNDRFCLVYLFFKQVSNN